MAFENLFVTQHEYDSTISVDTSNEANIFPQFHFVPPQIEHTTKNGFSKTKAQNTMNLQDCYFDSDLNASNTDGFVSFTDLGDYSFPQKVNNANNNSSSSCDATATTYQGSFVDHEDENDCNDENQNIGGETFQLVFEQEQPAPQHRRVRFQETAEGDLDKNVLPVLSRKDMTQEERDASFYNERDYRRMQQEYHVVKRERLAATAVQAVLKEQRRQHYAGLYDEMLLAKVYQELSEPCRDDAARIGVQQSEEAAEF